MIYVHRYDFTSILDYDNRNLLHIACESNNLPLIRFLVDECHINVNAIDFMNETPLVYAMRLGDVKVIEFLQNRGAVVVNSIMGSRLCKAGFDGRVDVLKLMDKHLVSDWNVADYDLRTALHLAVCERNYDAVKWLLSSTNANAEVRDFLGNTPIDDAMRIDANDIMDLFKKIRPKAAIHCEIIGLKSRNIKKR